MICYSFHTTRQPSAGAGAGCGSFQRFPNSPRTVHSEPYVGDIPQGKSCQNQCTKPAGTKINLSAHKQLLKRQSLAAAQVGRGQLSRAMKTLRHETRHPVTEDILQQLAAKHPPGPSPDRSALLPSSRLSHCVPQPLCPLQPLPPQGQGWQSPWTFRAWIRLPHPFLQQASLLQGLRCHLTATIAPSKRRCSQSSEPSPSSTLIASVGQWKYSQITRA